MPTFQEFKAVEPPKPAAPPTPKDPVQPQVMPEMGQGEDPSAMAGGDSEDTPEFEVGKKVTINEPMMGVRPEDDGTIVGVQEYMVGVLFSSQPQAPIWLDKQLLTIKEEGEDGDGDGFTGEN